MEQSPEVTINNVDKINKIAITDKVPEKLPEKQTKLPSGVPFLDAFLNGGYDQDIITTIYGPSGSGKTNLCLMAAVKMAQSGKKVLFMDTEGGIAVERIKQLSPDHLPVLRNLLFFNPISFNEQKEFFLNLDEQSNPQSGAQLGLIVVDSISMLYRLELGQNEEVFDVNAALGKQIASLVGLARRKNIPVLLTTQVYANFNNPDKIKMVGGDLLRYGSKCLLELQRLPNCRVLILRKHRSLPEGKEVKFKIVQEGLEEVK